MIQGGWVAWMHVVGGVVYRSDSLILSHHPSHPHPTAYERRVREQKLRVEMMQAKKENALFAQLVEKKKVRLLGRLRVVVAVVFL